MNTNPENLERLYRNANRILMAIPVVLLAIAYIAVAVEILRTVLP